MKSRAETQELPYGLDEEQSKDSSVCGSPVLIMEKWIQEDRESDSNRDLRLLEGITQYKATRIFKIAFERLNCSHK